MVIILRTVKSFRQLCWFIVKACRPIRAVYHSRPNGATCRQLHIIVWKNHILIVSMILHFGFKVILTLRNIPADCQCQWGSLFHINSTVPHLLIRHRFPTLQADWLVFTHYNTIWESTYRDMGQLIHHSAQQFGPLFFGKAKLSFCCNIQQLCTRKPLLIMCSLMH